MEREGVEEALVVGIEEGKRGEESRRSLNLNLNENGIE